MKKKVISMAIMLCIWEVVLFAQKRPPPLESRSTVWYTLLMQPSSTCSCFPTPPLTKKQGPTLSVDLSISPFWDTVKNDRIKNRSVQFGGTATPMKNTVMFGGWPVPRVTFAVSDLRAILEGGIMKTLDVDPFRTMEQARSVLEGSLWHALVGAEGFFGQEQILTAYKGVNFNADFRRRSSGGQGWLGVKFGDFNRSFVTGRYGKGYARTEGATHFNVPNIEDLDWFPLYFEEFKTTSFSVEGKAKAKRISQLVWFNRTEYKRVILSPDSLRFGENRLEDMWLRTETEVTPFSRARLLRGVVIFTKDFRDQNRLMFINDYPSLRVLLRLSFN